jgi:hypothetical protein
LFRNGPSHPISPDPPSQAGASLVWGHKKIAFEDEQGYQWRAWFNECGRAFKIKAAWGHPEIVRKAEAELAPLFNIYAD